MNYYVDIKLRPDPEFQASMLMSSLFGKLHRALGERAKGDIGVSFPEVKPDRPWLGGVLRLHGAHDSLEELMAMTWLKGMHDHVHVGKVSVVPSEACYRIVRRVQAKSSAERLRRRQVQRKGMSIDEARATVPDTVEERLDLPYVRIRSFSTGQHFLIFIDHGPVGNEQARGSFSTYGLSATATVPWF